MQKVQYAMHSQERCLRCSLSEKLCLASNLFSEDQSSLAIVTVHMLVLSLTYNLVSVPTLLLRKHLCADVQSEPRLCPVYIYPAVLSTILWNALVRAESSMYVISSFATLLVVAAASSKHSPCNKLIEDQHNDGSSQLSLDIVCVSSPLLHSVVAPHQHKDQGQQHGAPD